MALVAVSIFAIITMAGLSIDIGTLYQASAEAQRSADAAALAAARTISMSGITTDPSNSSGTWSQICGGAGSPASLAAIATAQQNSVAGASVTVTVNYLSPAGTPSADCSAAGTGFGVNPLVTVTVQQSNLPVYFSRIWGATPPSVSATATAEAFNSSDTSYATLPRCVKPWVVPNLDPDHTPQSFVNTTNDGSIQNPGTAANGGVIGETFTLTPDCNPGSTSNCQLINPTPQPNTLPAAQNPSLQYVPGQVSTSTAIPACKTTPLADGYAQAIAGCDQSTQYQCGVTNANSVDLTEYPGGGAGDTAYGAQCLTHQDAGTTTTGNGQDGLVPIGSSPNYPFQIQAGGNNPLVSEGLTNGNTISSSTSIATVPIYNQNGSILASDGVRTVTIVGFLQVFINYVDGNGNVNVTVMNIVGCGSDPSNTFNGTSPVPVRLVH
jgi:hypothetical protein